MAKDIHNTLNTTVDPQLGPESDGPESHRRQQEGSDAIFSWEADNHDIPRLIDQHPASSESTAPTLRDLSLSTLAGESPQTQQDDNPPLFIQLDQRDAIHAPGRVSEFLSVDDETPSLSSSQPGVPDIVAVGSGFPTSGHVVGHHVVSEEGTPTDSHAVTEPGHRMGTKQVKEGEMASSIITTPSASGEVGAWYTVNCFAEHKNRPNPEGDWGWFVARLDTGSDHNLMGIDVAGRLGIEDLIKRTPGRVEEIEGLNGLTRIIGVLPLNFSIPKKNNARVRLRFKVIPPHEYIDVIIGKNCVRTYNLVDEP